MPGPVKVNPLTIYLPAGLRAQAQALAGSIPVGTWLHLQVARLARMPLDVGALSEPAGPYPDRFQVRLRRWERDWLEATRGNLPENEAARRIIAHIIQRESP